MKLKSLAPQEEAFCLVIRLNNRLNNRVFHWHWPKSGIVNCENSKSDSQDQL